MNARNTTTGQATWWPKLAAGILLLGVGTLLGRTMFSSTAATSVEKDTDSKVIRDKNSDDPQRLAALEQQVRRLQADNLRQQQVAKVAEQSARQAAGENEPQVERTPEEAKRLAEANRLTYLEGLERKLNTEAQDPAWRNQVEPAIAELLPERLGEGISVDKVSCASSVCRARVNHPGFTHLPSEKLTAFLDKRGPLSNLELQFDTHEDGVTTLYFLRSPEVEPAP